MPVFYFQVVADGETITPPAGADYPDHAGAMAHANDVVRAVSAAGLGAGDARLQMLDGLGVLLNELAIPSGITRL